MEPDTDCDDKPAEEPAPVYKGAAGQHSPADVTRAAERLGVPDASLLAVMEVECRGRGFDGDGRLTMLYEPHIAHRYTKGTTRAALVKAKLAASKWGAIPYPYTSNGRYEQWHKVAEIAGEELACIACSWGLPQGMGFNHKAFGYRTARDMVAAFAESEAEQLDALARFIIANPSMHKALRERRWAGFAYAYNGPSYKKNKYDEKLAAAFIKHNKGKVFASGLVRRGDKGEDARRVQQALIDLGYKLIADGDFGVLTQQAVKDFQKKRKLAADGVVGKLTAAALGITIA